MKSLHLIISIFAIALLCSCGDGPAFMEYKHTPQSGWEKNDTISFCVPAAEKSGDYALTLLLRTDNTFPFMSVEMLVDVTEERSLQHERYTMICELTNERGITKGNGINLFQHSFPIATRHLEPGDSLHVTVRHNMKREILPGIPDVGLLLTEQ